MEKDSSNLRANQEELQDLIRQKEASIQAKGRLIDNMAYQIRTLSNAVIGFSDLLLSEELSDELTEYVSEINQAGNGLSSLVNEVLDWARLESGRLQISHKKFELSTIIRRIERIVASSAAERGLDFEIQVDPDLPSHILSDDDRLLKCLINLISNALKYTRQGFIRVRVLSECRDGKPCVRFDISDSGIGMTAEQIEHLFEPTLHTEDANSEISTLLDIGNTVTAGFPLTKQLVDLLDGVLEVHSEQNIGSTFSLILPIALEVENMGKLGTWTAAPQDEPKPSKKLKRTPSVLLVEDQQSNRTVISLMLEALGVLVETAEDGQEGIDKASKKEYDLILMDLKMPRVDGYQACQKIREDQPQTPIVALSAKVLSEKENEQITSMFNGFLTKPVDSHNLSEIIEKFVPKEQRPLRPKETVSTQPMHERDDENVVTFEYGNE